MESNKRRIAGLIVMSMLAFGLVSLGGLATATDQATQLEEPAPEEPSLPDETPEQGEALEPVEETEEPEMSEATDETSVQSSSPSRSSFSPARPSKVKSSSSPQLRASRHAPALSRAANGGTIKIDQQDIDDGKGNEPQKEDCEFQVDYYNFPVPGSATATFTLVSPTAGGVVGTVFTTFSPANGAGLVGSGVGNISAGIAASGIPPHTNGKGHHISVDIVTSDGTTKSKTVWVRGCVATLIIDKNVTGTGSSGSTPFAFTDDVPHDSVGTLTGNQTPKSMLVVANQAWHITEDTPLPAGYTLTSDNCTNGDQASAVTLQPDTSVTCTFLNTFTQPGTLQIDKQVSGTNDATLLNKVFDLTSPDVTVADMSHNSAVQSIQVAGNSTVTLGETLTANEAAQGWSFTSINCGGAGSSTTPSIQVTVPSGQTVSCTVNNLFTQPQTPPPTPDPAGTIVVDKVTDPSGDPTVFDFNLSGGAVNVNFGLADSSIPFDSGPIAPGSYNVTETLPAGWNLASGTCSDGSLPGAVSLQDGETVTCTFTNTKLATISVEKQTDPDGSPQTFDFTGDITATLGDGGQASASVLPGTYSVEETAEPAWDLLSVDCSSDPTADSVGDVATATASFEVSAGETVTCVFTNQLIPVVEPTRIDKPGNPGEDPPVVEGRGPSEPGVLPFTGAGYVTLISALGLLLIAVGTPLARWRRRIRAG